MWSSDPAGSAPASMGTRLVSLLKSNIVPTYPEFDRFLHLRVFQPLLGGTDCLAPFFHHDAPFLLGDAPLFSAAHLVNALGHRQRGTQTSPSLRPCRRRISTKKLVCISLTKNTRTVNANGEKNAICARNKEEVSANGRNEIR